MAKKKKAQKKVKLRGSKKTAKKKSSAKKKSRGKKKVIKQKKKAHKKKAPSTKKSSKRSTKPSKKKIVKKPSKKPASKLSTPALSKSGPTHKVRAAINGFGRIGRMVLKASLLNKNIEVVAINDLTPPKTLAHLLKYDSVHGKFKGEVSATPCSLIINGKEIPVYSQKDPIDLPWTNLRIDLVLECTGRFLTRTLSQRHLRAGARKVLLSAPHKCTPSEDVIKTIVLGVNDKSLKRTDVIVSNASCTTNCFAPMVHILHSNFKIKSGYMTTIHAATATQHLVDGPDKKLRRARSALVNIIPTTTGAARAIGQVITDLDGKLDASSIRVPVANGSICYFTAHVEKKADVSEVNKAFLHKSQHKPGIVSYVKEPIVSQDIIGDPHSCIFDSLLTKTNGHVITVAAWYDNEWGYSCRMIDLAVLMFL